MATTIIATLALASVAHGATPIAKPKIKTSEGMTSVAKEETNEATTGNAEEGATKKIAPAKKSVIKKQATPKPSATKKK